VALQARARSACASVTEPGEEEEGLQGVFKRLRRNGHQLEKGLHHHHHHHQHQHHQITKLSHSINAIGPAPHRSGEKGLQMAQRGPSLK
jgi:hypothetical protein